MQRVVWEDQRTDAAAADQLAAALAVPPVIARLLVQRGLTSADAAHAFLHPALSQLHDPFRLADMRPAVARLMGAIARQERIAIHGDYDVDGITSTVMLRRALELLGANVTHFVPERLRDGYGLQPATIDRLLSEIRIAVAQGRRRRAGFSSAVRRSVPVRTFADWGDPPPGFVEVDFVAHSGTSTAGAFVQTMVLTDIATGWTECVGV